MNTIVKNILWTFRLPLLGLGLLVILFVVGWMAYVVHTSNARAEESQAQAAAIEKARLNEIEAKEQARQSRLEAQAKAKAVADQDEKNLRESLEQEAKRKAQDKLDAEQARVQGRQVRITRYIREKNRIKHPPAHEIAIIAVDVNGKLDPTLAKQFAQGISSNTQTATISLFTDFFVSDGLFEKLFNGTADVLTDLDVADRVDELLLIKSTVAISLSKSLPGVTVADIVVTTQLVKTASGQVIDAHKFAATGAELNVEKAQAAALDRVIDQYNKFHAEKNKTPK